jgi:hypothetical protein
LHKVVKGERGRKGKGCIKDCDVIFKGRDDDKVDGNSKERGISPDQDVGRKESDSFIGALSL